MWYGNGGIQKRWDICPTFESFFVAIRTHRTFGRGYFLLIAYCPIYWLNIFKELNADLGISIPNNGELTDWAKQGVLMMNTVLTVRQGQPNSHKGKGWEQLTDAVIKKLNELP